MSGGLICALTEPSTNSTIRMDQALRVDDHLDVVPVHVEQPPRLNDFESLVHQRGRVDRDLRAHVPGRMLQRLGGRHLIEHLDVVVAKRPA